MRTSELAVARFAQRRAADLEVLRLRNAQRPRRQHRPGGSASRTATAGRFASSAPCACTTSPARSSGCSRDARTPRCRCPAATGSRAPRPLRSRRGSCRRETRAWESAPRPSRGCATVVPSVVSPTEMPTTRPSVNALLTMRVPNSVCSWQYCSSRCSAAGFIVSALKNVLSASVTVRRVTWTEHAADRQVPRNRVPASYPPRCTGCWRPCDVTRGASRRSSPGPSQSRAAPA